MYALDPAAVDMREAIAQFIERVIVDSVDASPEQKASFVANTRANLLRWAAAPDTSLHLTAAVGDELAGVVLVRDYWNLCHLFVAPAHQGRGLGRQLVEAALSGCKHRSPRGVVRLNSSRNALGFYRHMGFIEVADAPPHLRGVQLEYRLEASPDKSIDTDGRRP
jgi:GNAT superfamily N-acetyltransferase